MRSSWLFLLIVFACCFKGLAQTSAIDSLQQLILLAKTDKEKAFHMNLLAAEFLRKDQAKAKAILYQTIAIGQALKDARTLSASYHMLVTVHQNTGVPDSSVYYLSLMQRLSGDATGPETDIIKGNYFSTAGLFYKNSGNPKMAIPYFQQAVAVWEREGSKLSKAGQLLNLGNTYRDIGDYKNALASHLKALSVFEEVNNKRGESFCYQSISNSFAALKQYEDALKYSKKAISLKTELNDKRGLGTAQDGLGTIYLSLEKYDQALICFTQALQIAKELNLLVDQGKAYFNIGKTHHANKNAKAAMVNFNHSKKVALQLGDSSLAAASDIELIALQKGMTLQQAETKMVSGLELLTKTGDRIKQAAGYKNLAHFYESNQQFDNALKYTNKYYSLHDSIQNNELQLQVKKMEEQYTVQKKENEISLLKKDQQLNEAKLEKQKAFQIGGVLFVVFVLLTGFIVINRYRVLQRAKRQIEIEKMRNNIARDLHDDIGSTITSINILSSVLLQQRGESGANHSSLEKIKENSAHIMESMSDIVWAINPHNDTVEKFIYRMKEFAAEILEPLGISFGFEQKGDIASVKLDPAKRKDLFLIYKEAINNAAKYSCCSNIYITLQYDGKNLQMNITDDGKGFDETIARKGNGIRNIRERAKEMPALLKYNTIPGNGTSVLLDVPLT